MKISYNWLKDFIPEAPDPEKLSNILTAVGLEVERFEKFEEIRGGLDGLLVGKVLQCEKHPQADNLKITKIDICTEEILQIVCGAPNVRVGQKVIVAPIGCTIYPINDEPVTIKKVMIRGIESFGMICAEDEVGLGNNHEGIVILPENVETGSRVSDYYEPYNDWIFEIGLTPNRMDAMSHMGVSKDIYGYLLHHDKKEIAAISPFIDKFEAGNNSLPIEIIIENTQACERYAGVSIANLHVKPSPRWMQVRLKSIGLRPINNIVDITNYILHDTGQPLHAFDGDSIKGNKIIVKNLPEGTSFITLDEKERKLSANDLMICNGANEPMCFGGVFGGLHTGVTDSTSNVFLESAWFNPVAIRNTSIRHSLRTDAAIRFEKGVDISQTVQALKRAAKMIKEIAGGEIASHIIDVYPNPKQKKSVTLTDSYLRKISGKNFARQTVKNILQSLGFEFEKEQLEYLDIAIPLNKTDVSFPADIVEEIMRIDGYDNVCIPSAITIAPAIETGALEASYKEKIAHYLIGSGFSEIFTNSITNSSYYDEVALINSVKIINSLSVDLDILRPALMETGLQCIAYNLNRRNDDLLLFEFGNSYMVTGTGEYSEKEHLCLYISGNKAEFGWKGKPVKGDFFFLKGICENIFTACGLSYVEYSLLENNRFENGLSASVSGELIAEMGIVNKNISEKFSIKQPILFADLNWKIILNFSKNVTIEYIEIPKFPAVHRDLSLVVNKNISYAQIENLIKNLSINKLVNVKLFDVFESDKIGFDKKSYAVSFTFTDMEKTLTDKEIDSMMKNIIGPLEKKLGAEIRK